MQSLIVHPVSNAKRLITAGVVASSVTEGTWGRFFLSWTGIHPNGLRYLNDGDIVMLLCKSAFIPYCSVLEDVRGREQGLARCLNHDSFVFSTFMRLILHHLFPSWPNVPLIRMSYSFGVLHQLLQKERDSTGIEWKAHLFLRGGSASTVEDNYWFEIRKDKAQPWAARR